MSSKESVIDDVERDGSVPETHTPELVQDHESAEEITEPTLGVPTKRRRTAKIDPILAEAQGVARSAILEITKESAIGPVHHLRGEEERLTTHLFECSLPGYRGWFWFATLSRAPRSKKATVCEMGLLPGDDALLAPEWVPWSERLKNITAEDLEELRENNAIETLEALDETEADPEETEETTEED